MLLSHIFTHEKWTCNALLTTSNNLKICTYISENYSIYTCDHELTYYALSEMFLQHV